MSPNFTQKQMKSKLGYIIAGIICGVLVFVLVLLPHIEHLEASSVPAHEYTEERGVAGCFPPCQTYVSCGGECEDGEECCSSGAPKTGSCLYCEQ